MGLEEASEMVPGKMAQELPLNWQRGRDIGTHVQVSGRYHACCCLTIRRRRFANFSIPAGRTEGFCTTP